MRQILAISSVTLEDKKLIFDEFKKISKQINLSLDIILQEQLNSPQSALLESKLSFNFFPYITLSIPNYQEHRLNLEKIYKSTVIFNKFILLISNGRGQQELIQSKNEELIKEHCRSWNTRVQCVFDSSPVVTRMEQQIILIKKVLIGIDIRGKITEIDAKMKFYLIQTYQNAQDTHQFAINGFTANKSKLFFGMEIEYGRREEQIYYPIASDKDQNQLIDDRDLLESINATEDSSRLSLKQAQRKLKSQRRSTKRTIQNRKQKDIHNSATFDLRKKKEIKLIVLSQTSSQMRT